MICFPNAKINIGLQVVARRPDSYHELRTVFYPIGKRSGTPADPGCLSDILEVTLSDSDSFMLSGRRLDCRDEDNIVLKSLRLFRKHCADLPPVSIFLEKHLPFGAGMGAGSADAAFTLKALNGLVDCRLTDEQLMIMARSLGADVPFFLVNTPCLASGIGEKLSQVDIPQLRGKWIAVIKPEAAISTAQAFSLITPREPEVDLAEALKEPITMWKHIIANDFEQSMFAIHPEIRGIKDHLYSCGALYASMTGSGSAFYGIFADELQARKAIDSSDETFRQISILDD